MTKKFERFSFYHSRLITIFPLLHCFSFKFIFHQAETLHDFLDLSVSNATHFFSPFNFYFCLWKQSSNSHFFLVKFENITRSIGRQIFNDLGHFTRELCFSDLADITIREQSSIVLRLYYLRRFFCSKCIIAKIVIYSVQSISKFSSSRSFFLLLLIFI